MITSFLLYLFSYRDTSDSPQTLSKKELEYYTERQQLAVEFIFCLTLTEILQQVNGYIRERNGCIREEWMYKREEWMYNIVLLIERGMCV